MRKNSDRLFLLSPFYLCIFLLFLVSLKQYVNWNYFFFPQVFYMYKQATWVSTEMVSLHKQIIQIKCIEVKKKKVFPIPFTSNLIFLPLSYYLPSLGERLEITGYYKTQTLTNIILTLISSLLLELNSGQNSLQGQNSLYG